MNIKYIIYILIFVFVIINGIAIFHAYRFTHFISSNIEKTANPETLTLLDKIETLLLGIKNPKPINNIIPNITYETIILNDQHNTNMWYMTIDKNIESKGLIVVAHGYSSCKAKMLDKAYEFLKLDYDVLLVDLLGTGDNYGNLTTIGYYKANTIRDIYEYINDHKLHKNIILYGTSMGAVAIIKSIHENHIKPQALILECPYGSLLETVQSRFKNMNIPSFPMAHLLVFWGGVINNLNAFNLQPSEYAKSINIPTLLMYGLQDKSVTLEETNNIYNNLKGVKKLITFPNAGHENYLLQYKNEWNTAIKEFLN